MRQGPSRFRVCGETTYWFKNVFSLCLNIAEGARKISGVLFASFFFFFPLKNFFFLI